MGRLSGGGTPCLPSESSMDERQDIGAGRTAPKRTNSTEAIKTGGQVTHGQQSETMSRKAGAAVTTSETVGYVPGGFDMLHIGHLNILRAAREQCSRLVVGVAADASLIAMKGHPPVIPHFERMQLVAHLNFVDDVVTDYSQDKRLAWQAHPFDLLFKGDDWAGTPKGHRLEAEMAEVGVTVVYLPYTPSTSSTMLRQFLLRSDVADSSHVPELLRK